MKPFIKWQGGKRRELPHIRKYIPSDTRYIVEPFCGGAAVSFDYQLPSALNDTDSRLINLYQHVQQDVYPFLEAITKFKTYDTEKLSATYYCFRDYINSNRNELSYEAALAFLFIRQQCFSGMERYNSKGDYNVPWGRYKKFSCSLTEEHSNFLKQCSLSNKDAVDLLDNIDSEAFLFIDPPYLERAGYENKDGGLDMHQRLSEKLHSISNPFLIVHSDHEFYRNAYKDYLIDEVPFKYAQQFKGGDYNASVNHLYIYRRNGDDW